MSEDSRRQNELTMGSSIELQLEDGTNIALGTPFREKFTARRLPWYLPSAARAGVNWKQNLNKLRGRFDSLIDRHWRAECLLIQRLIPHLGETPATTLPEGLQYRQLVGFGPGLSKEPAELCGLGKPICGQFSILNAQGRPFLQRNGSSQPFRLGLDRTFLIYVTPDSHRLSPIVPLNDLLQDGQKLLFELPPTVAARIWRNWSAGFSQRRSTYLWLDALFELAWQREYGSPGHAKRYVHSENSTLTLTGSGLFPRLPNLVFSQFCSNEHGYPRALYSSIPDIARASITAIDEILSYVDPEKKGPDCGRTPTVAHATNTPKKRNGRNAIEVFISYAHTSPGHSLMVTELTRALRETGLTVIVDEDVPTPQGPPEGWPKWMKRCIKRATWVLLFFDEGYRRRFDGEEDNAKGHGATWEASIITNALYRNGTNNSKFIPILAEGSARDLIPPEFSSYTHYVVPTQTSVLATRLLKT